MTSNERVKNKTQAGDRQMTNATIEIEARAKAFSGEGVKTHRFEVDPTGDVRVWDEVAGYFTNCNSLSESAKKRIAKLAAELAVGE
jgi:hypothetical protein